MPSLDDFVDNLGASLHLEARREFGPIERRLLAMSMEACGMTEYPTLTGPKDGERCSGEMVCEQCGRDYFSHPSDWRVIGYGNVPFLNVLCDGRRVKL